MWLTAGFLESDGSSIHHRSVDDLDRVHYDDDLDDVRNKIDGGKRSTAMTICCYLGQSQAFLYDRTIEISRTQRIRRSRRTIAMELSTVVVVTCITCLSRA